jgi:hypothetical protein
MQREVLADLLASPANGCGIARDVVDGLAASGRLPRARRAHAAERPKGCGSNDQALRPIRPVNGTVGRGDSTVWSVVQVTAGDGSATGWDFFVSYTQTDGAWAEWIAWILEKDGHRVLVQAWDSVPGSKWIQSMQAGVVEAARTIAVLSGDYLGSVYGGAESQAAWATDPDGGQRKLLSVHVTDSDRPGLLAGVVGVDLFGLSEAAAKARLRSMASTAVRRQVKPSVASSFPGAGRAMPRAVPFPGTATQDDTRGNKTPRDVTGVTAAGFQAESMWPRWAAYVATTAGLVFGAAAVAPDGWRRVSPCWGRGDFSVTRQVSLTM